MSEASFSSAVLQRYRWSVPASEGGESARAAMLRGILQQRGSGQDIKDMPAWEATPAVTQGVKDLYAYLSSAKR